MKSSPQTTGKPGALAVIEALKAGGVRHVVVSPGSRCVPLVMAAARSEELQVVSVIDERCAAFVALGLVRATDRPVAVVCTSGSALLDCAPALAEAYYSGAPIVLVSADRPERLVDQDDSQTMRQRGALAPVVKQSYDIPEATGLRYALRVACEAVAEACRMPKGPVHINIQFDIPLAEEAPCAEPGPAIVDMPVRPMLTPDAVSDLARALASHRRVLIVVGFGASDPLLAEAIAPWMAAPGVVVVAEPQSNVAGALRPDLLLSQFTPDELRRMAPDLLITIGGSVVSHALKSWLREAQGIEHWSVTPRTQMVDTFGRLTRRIGVEAPDFFRSVGAPQGDAAWSLAMTRAAAEAHLELRRAVDAAPWCDLKATDALLRAIPADYDLSLSNGMAVRCAALCGVDAPTDCNRGISGIDGSTSTAIGRALAGVRKQLLLTGDMSAQYDLGALAIRGIPPTFRMAVLANGDGSIFHYVATTRHLPELASLVSPQVNLPLRQLAEAFGFDYLEAADEAALAQALPAFFAPSSRPVILTIRTDSSTGASEVLRFMNRKR